MSKAVKPHTINTGEAIINLATRLQAVEKRVLVQFKAMETKIGDHENKFIDDAPDMDQITEMFKLLRTKIDEQSERIGVLEGKNDIVPKKKKGGTVKLNDLEPEPVSVGITF
jgi:hypothetical protein